MNKPQLGNDDCPPNIELSAWHDGQAAVDLREHLDLCHRCRATLESYRRIDRAVQQAVCYPVGLADRIKTNCRKGPAPGVRQQPLHFPALWYAAAAGAAAVFVAAFIIFAGGRGPITHIADSDQNTPEAPSAQSAPVADTSPLPTSESPRIGTDRQGDRIQPSSLVMVDASGRTRSTSYRTIIPSAVRHVWVVNDVGTSRQQLLDALPQGCTAHAVDTRDSAVKYRIQIPDSSLPPLVNRFAEAGWALLSPDLPQPGQADEVFAVGIEVRYEVELVGREQQP